MSETGKQISPEQEAFHQQAEARVHTFSYQPPENQERPKAFVDLLRTPNVRMEVQVVKEGGENNMHYHTGSDGVWMVLKGGARFYGFGDKVIGDLKEMEGIVIPGGTRYWFETTAAPLEILHISAYENSAGKDKRINWDRPPDWILANPRSD